LGTSGGRGEGEREGGKGVGKGAGHKELELGACREQYPCREVVDSAGRDSVYIGGGVRTIPTPRLIFPGDDSHFIGGVGVEGVGVPGTVRGGSVGPNDGGDM